MMMSQEKDQMTVVRDLIREKELFLKSDRMMGDELSASFTSKDLF